MNRTACQLWLIMCSIVLIASGSSIYADELIQLQDELKALHASYQPLLLENATIETAIGEKGEILTHLHAELVRQKDRKAYVQNELEQLKEQALKLQDAPTARSLLIDKNEQARTKIYSILNDEYMANLWKATNTTAVRQAVTTIMMKMVTTVVQFGKNYFLAQMVTVLNKNKDLLMSLIEQSLISGIPNNPSPIVSHEDINNSIAAYERSIGDVQTLVTASVEQFITEIGRIERLMGMTIIPQQLFIIPANVLLQDPDLEKSGMAKWLGVLFGEASLDKNSSLKDYIIIRVSDALTKALKEAIALVKKDFGVKQ